MANIDRNLVLNIEQCDLIIQNDMIMLGELNEVMFGQPNDDARNAVSRCIAIVASNLMHAKNESVRLSLERNN